MAIPIIYNIRSVKARYVSSFVAILAIAGVVSVFVAVLAMANGFRRTLMISGSPQNAIILRGGATSEIESSISLEQTKIIGDTAGIQRDKDGKALISPEVVGIQCFKLRSSGTDANVQIRGVSDNALKIRSQVKISRGRFFTPGLAELVVGSNAIKSYDGMDLNGKIKFGGEEWTIVGIMEAGGSSFDSEVWCDHNILRQTYKGNENSFQSVTVQLETPETFPAFKDAISLDPRLTVSVEQEIAYYEKRSEMVFTLIKVLGFLVAFVMGIGAIFGALNTMYSAISARSTEIATLRAIGFSERSILFSFILESLFLALLGGALGCIIIIPAHGQMASTINWQTFSHLNFSFAISTEILLSGMIFAFVMGFLGGLLPAWRASRMPVAVALRGL
ncbi:MAG: ABC transporter permease [Candidatus Brocadiae bacterium]|nr:ABC transporter permease [Candidatus Brocadiia bacterium]